MSLGVEEWSIPTRMCHFSQTREHSFYLETMPHSRDCIASSDMALLAANHDAFDHDLIARSLLMVRMGGVYLKPVAKA